MSTIPEEPRDPIDPEDLVDQIWGEWIAKKELEFIGERVPNWRGGGEIVLKDIIGNYENRDQQEVSDISPQSAVYGAVGIHSKSGIEGMLLAFFEWDEIRRTLLDRPYSPYTILPFIGLHINNDVIAHQSEDEEVIIGGDTLEILQNTGHEYLERDSVKAGVLLYKRPGDDTLFRRIFRCRYNLDSSQVGSISIPEELLESIDLDSGITLIPMPDHIVPEKEEVTK